MRRRDQGCRVPSTHRARNARRTPLILVMTLLSGVAFADIQARRTPRPTRRSAPSPRRRRSAGSGRTGRRSGALVIAVVIVGVVRRPVPEGRAEVPDGRADGKAPPAAPGGRHARPLAPPPSRPRSAATVGAAPAAGAAAPRCRGSRACRAARRWCRRGRRAGARRRARPAAGGPAATRPPSPRHEPVEPDQATFDRVLAEQLAKGTDRRVAEGRAKAAALKAAREKAGG